MVLHRDLEELEVKTIEQSSAASVTTNRYRSCLDAAKFIKPDLFSRISAEKLRLQFREFMLRLGQLALVVGRGLVFELESVYRAPLVWIRIRSEVSSQP